MATDGWTPGNPGGAKHSHQSILKAIRRFIPGRRLYREPDPAIGGQTAGPRSSPGRPSACALIPILILTTRFLWAVSL